MAILVIDDELDDIATYIQMVQERVHDELMSFRLRDGRDGINLEVGAFQEKLETWLQDGFERHVLSIKDSLHDFEQTRRGNSDLAEIKDQRERLGAILQHETDMHRHLETGSKKIKTLEDSISEKQIKISSDSRCTTSTDKGLSSTCPTSSEKGTSRDNDKTGYQNLYQNTEEDQSKLVAQWVIASQRAKMTPEEFEKERKLRQKRVDMRRGSGRDGYCQGVWNTSN